jgi:serine protease Do
LLVGESVIAIGNPLGELGGTVTNGIISALDREITIDGNRMTLLQTNAAVNPGNSGGGLFDSTGMLIGIVNAKESDSGIEGLGFAIPADRVLKNVTDILEIGYITGRAGLGISVYAANGVYGVYAVESSGVFKADDRIVAINGEAIHTLSDYNAVLSELTIGETVTVVVMRDDSSYKEFEVKVIEDESK